MGDILTELGIGKSNDVSDMLVIDIDNSDDYAKYYTILDNSDEVELSLEKSKNGLSSNILVYESNQFEISLMGNFEDDTYRLVVKDLDDILPTEGEN